MTRSTDPKRPSAFGVVFSMVVMIVRVFGRGVGSSRRAMENPEQWRDKKAISNYSDAKELRQYRCSDGAGRHGGSGRPHLRMIMQLQLWDSRISATGYWIVEVQLI